jgi:hypothetical protein
MRVYMQVSGNVRESGVLNLFSQLAGKGERVRIGRGGCVRGNRESDFVRNVRGGNRTGVRATLAAPRKGSKQVNRLGWWV